MSVSRVHGGGPFTADLELPGDKSITHRAFLIGSLSGKTVRVIGALDSADTRSTLGALEALGSGVIRRNGGAIDIVPAAWCSPAAPIDCGNSGTTARLLAGLLAATPISAILTGDASLRRRPMRRIIDPLSAMGARIGAEAGTLPIEILGGGLRTGTRHELAVASAQVKSAILLAATRAGVAVSIHEPGPARDHTERMLSVAGRPVTRLPGGWLELEEGPRELSMPNELNIPGDISSAAFLFVAAAITGGRARVQGLGVNPTRTGVLDLLGRAGARVVIEPEDDRAGEAVATVTVEGGELRGFEVSGGEVVRAIDELPAIAVLAAAARGRSVVADAAELRVKESDRIRGICSGLAKLGARVEERPDGFVVEGGGRLAGGSVDAEGDHRLAMAFAVAGLAARGTTDVIGAECVDVSFPGFWGILRTGIAPGSAP
ncbi:MAG: 3-phosphoshikimate 1-carboxyvinyltransferase [Gemmatimonadetes bacterium]|nr:3-phosphoshikimate 1-carboxyvinyltransferase [Gemmatimonadota bacterium]